MLLLRNLVEEKLKGLVLILDTNLTVLFCSRLQVFNMRRCLVTVQRRHDLSVFTNKRVFSCMYMYLSVCIYIHGERSGY